MSFPQLIGQVAAATASSGGLVTILALFGTAAAIITSVSGIFLQRRRDTTTARKDYVDGSLAALQAIIDRQAIEDTRLRALNEERLKRIDTLEEELAEVHAELTRCRKKCDDALKRIGRLEREQTT